MSEFHDWFNLLSSCDPRFSYHWITILNLLRVLLLLINDGGVKLLLFLVTVHIFLDDFLGSHSERDEYLMPKVHR